MRILFVIKDNTHLGIYYVIFYFFLFIFFLICKLCKKKTNNIQQKRLYFEFNFVHFLWSTCHFNYPRKQIRENENHLFVNTNL